MKSYAADMRMYKRSYDKPMKPSQTLYIAKEDANSRGFVPVVHKCKSAGKCEARIQAITTDEARSVDAHQRDGNTLPMLKHPLHGSRHGTFYYEISSSIDNDNDNGNDDNDGDSNDSFGNGCGDTGGDDSGGSGGVTFFAENRSRIPLTWPRSISVNDADVVGQCRRLVTPVA
ncbi:hypothetical protein HZH68_000684 [Vespula germanica]|uniref:Uncharacterized protein n=1 Tax=Vespula germanica TaxID=30212 RepID=A0A834NU22_VESGE|nr:hypothetical protein HZH68_000684 [Vespula germanica]